MKLADVFAAHDYPVVAVVKLQHPETKDFPVPHTVLFMAILDAQDLSPSGKLIRFHHMAGEIHGWKVTDEVEVVEILGRRVGDRCEPIDHQVPEIERAANA